MYCPKCANPASEGQRYCRQCGANLGVIVDAMEGRRGPVDFERLKEDLKDLGNSLRTGFEQAHKEFRKTQSSYRSKRHKDSYNPFAVAPSASSSSDLTNNIDVSCFSPKKKFRQPGSARYHFQQAMLKILGGGAGTAVWYYLLKTAADSGLLDSLQQIILQHQPNLTGLVPVMQMLWMLGLVPVVQGIGHLLIAAVTPKEITPLTAPPQNVSAPLQPAEPITPPETREIKAEYPNVYSVTEDPTVPLTPSRQERQAS